MAPVKKKAAVRAAAKKPAEERPFCVYIGPSIRGAVQYGQILHGTLAEARETLGPLIGRFPLVGALVIPGELLSAARIQVKTHGTALCDQYNRLARALAREEGR